jgi:hypothetical protein
MGWSRIPKWIKNSRGNIFVPGTKPNLSDVAFSPVTRKERWTKNGRKLLPKATQITELPLLTFLQPRRLRADVCKNTGDEDNRRLLVLAKHFVYTITRNFDYR